MGNLQINGNVNIRDLLTLRTSTDAYTTPSIVFGNDARVGYGSAFSIYSRNNINLRPNNGTLGYSDGIELSTTALIPTKNNTVTLGNSTHKWSNVYATTFVGALSGNASSATKLETARTISLTGSVTGSGSFDGSGNLSIATITNHSHSYLPLAGGTMTGGIKFKASQYHYDSVYALHMNNSDIIGVNSLYWGDACNTAGEGLHFYKDGTNWASLWADSNGVLYWTPTHEAGATGTNYSVITTGNFTTHLNDTYVNVSGDTMTGTLSAQHLQPKTDSTYYLGTSSLGWARIYCNNDTAAGGYYLMGANSQYGRMNVAIVGTTSAVGETDLTLGNSTAAGTAGNARGYLGLYNNKAYCAWLGYQTDATATRTSYLRNYGATAYLVATTTTSAVGSSTAPVYISSSGVVTACSSSLGVSITGNAASATKANYIIDANNSTNISVRWSGAWETAPDGLACFKGYTIVPVQFSSITAGNSDKLDGYHHDAFAKQATWNNLIHSGNEFTFIPGSYNSSVWFNYRTASGDLDGNVSEYYFGNGKGGWNGPRLYAGGASFGYNNTSYRLSTSSFICNSWIRTKGSTGWYNEDYGGGWYMADSTWIRAYNNKQIYTGSSSNEAIKCDGGLTCGCLLLSNLGWTGYGTADPSSAGLTVVTGRVYFKLI